MALDELIKARVPAELRKKIKAAAEKEKRTEANMIRVILEKYFEQEGVHHEHLV